MSLPGDVTLDQLRDRVLERIRQTAGDDVEGQCRILMSLLALLETEDAMSLVALLAQEEQYEDRRNDDASARDKPPKGKRAEAKIATVMHEFKEGELHSGGSGKPVTSRKQAVAIALSEARR